MDRRERPSTSFYLQPWIGPALPRKGTGAGTPSFFPPALRHDLLGQGSSAGLSLSLIHI